MIKATTIGVTVEMLESARKRCKSPRRNSKDRQRWSRDNHTEKLPEIDFRWLYIFFLPARNLHSPAAVGLVLASSVGLFTLSMTFGTTYLRYYLPVLAVVWQCLPGNRYFEYCNNLHTYDTICILLCTLCLTMHTVYSMHAEVGLVARPGT